MVVKTTNRTAEAYKYAKAENSVKTETYTLNPGERVLIGHTDAWGGNMDVRYDYEYSFSIVGQLEEQKNKLKKTGGNNAPASMLAKARTGAGATVLNNQKIKKLWKINYHLKN